MSERDLLGIQLFKRQEEMVKTVQNLKTIDAEI